MILTAKQQDGLKIAIERFKNHEPWTCIAGYAGSGKSTLVRFIIEALDVEEDKVCYVAYTGKAATVLKQKGCMNAITAHKLLYDSRSLPNGSYFFVPKKRLEFDYEVIVVDEISMLPLSMWELLLKHKVYVLALGDPGQLPPIDKTEDNHVLDNPHIFLDEIMRQAQESEIIRLSMHVRQGLPLSDFKAEGRQVQIFQRSDLVSGMYTWADQILCATNGTRQHVNDFVRNMKGFGPEPQIGDKIISLKNHWDVSSDSGAWELTNGAIGTITNFTKTNMNLPRYISNTAVPILRTDMSLDNNDKFSSLPIDYTCLKTGEPFLTPKQLYLINKSPIVPEPPFDFAYAYAITTHKAQGSEWKKVLVIEERFPFEKSEHTRWLYTACTRASEKLVVVSK